MPAPSQCLRKRQGAWSERPRHPVGSAVRELGSGPAPGPSAVAKARGRGWISRPCARSASFGVRRRQIGPANLLARTAPPPRRAGRIERRATIGAPPEQTQTLAHNRGDSATGDRTAAKADPGRDEALDQASAQAAGRHEVPQPAPHRPLHRRLLLHCPEAGDRDRRPQPPDRPAAGGGSHGLAGGARIRVLGFTSQQLHRQLDGVLEQIARECNTVWPPGDRQCRGWRDMRLRSAKS